MESFILYLRLGKPATRERDLAALPPRRAPRGCLEGGGAAPALSLSNQPAYSLFSLPAPH
eukprot:scaffold46959_cov17-Tisochrysis_lutea.AAC.1